MVSSTPIATLSFEMWKLVVLDIELTAVCARSTRASNLTKTWQAGDAEMVYLMNPSSSLTVSS